MIGLAYLLFEQWDEVEADFQRYYRIDLRTEVLKVTRGEATLRRLGALILGLPAESALWRARVAAEQQQSRYPGQSHGDYGPTPRKRTARIDEILEFFGANLARGGGGR